ncbi:hypothetical protein I8752_25580 [Nostocaceae cyanobacterium CENA369]|uniref:Uncharacterized protein n=1 Tax=Dendronalium phyllosphericum CENA369 TaxID=1725256 RepID=A0A8J7I5J9_9NOST|nr:hypothetical protein [Dendronalium phyllosphericum]MBH8576301.1 hypothetical protein [Dendronalium phyllosphericum CENA369]
MNNFKNKTQAFIIRATVTAGDVELKALEDVIVVSGSIGLAGNYVTNPTGGATTVNVAGSVSQNIVENTTEGFLQNASVNAIRDLQLPADDTSQICAIAISPNSTVLTGFG